MYNQFGGPIKARQIGQALKANQFDQHGNINYLPKKERFLGLSSDLAILGLKKAATTFFNTVTDSAL
jgi:hypothetical protein